MAFLRAFIKSLEYSEKPCLIKKALRLSLKFVCIFKAKFVICEKPCLIKKALRLLAVSLLLPTQNLIVRNLA